MGAARMPLGLQPVPSLSQTVRYWVRLRLGLSPGQGLELPASELLAPSRPPRSRRSPT